MTTCPVTNDFDQQLKESNEKRHFFIKPMNESIKYLSEVKFKDDATTQIGFGTDGYYKLSNGRKYSAEFKTTQYQETVVLEIKHLYYLDKDCQKYKSSKEGWLYCSTADQIFFGMYNKEQTRFNRVVGFSILPFKNREFATKLANLDKRFAITKYKNGIYQKTLFCIAPVQFIKEHADWFIDWSYSESKKKHRGTLNEWI